MITVRPAPVDVASCSTTGWTTFNVSGVTSGLSTSMTVCTDLSAWPTRPSRETSASSAGKIARTA